MSRQAHRLSSNAWTKARTQESVAVVARHLRCAAPIKRIRRPLQRAIAQRFSRAKSTMHQNGSVWVNRPSFLGHEWLSLTELRALTGGNDGTIQLQIFSL